MGFRRVSGSDAEGGFLGRGDGFQTRGQEAEEKAEGGEEKRIDAFGWAHWLEDQGELPPELQLRVEEVKYLQRR